VGLLAVLGWCLIPYTVSSFISYDLIARGREITLLKATVVSLAGFLVLYLSLISLFNINGAVYAALAGEALQAAIYIFFLYRSGVSLQPLIVERSLK
jgi:O-antigen/teichoic acid export membrane protein